MDVVDDRNSNNQTSKQVCNIVWSKQKTTNIRYKQSSNPNHWFL